MTEQSFEYKVLRFLNDRVERYDVTDHSLKIVLYDIPENEYNQGMGKLRSLEYIKNKDLYEKGLSITQQGQIRLQQLQKIVDSEKEQATKDQNISPIIKTQLPFGISGGLFWAIITAVVTAAFFLGTVKYDVDKIRLSEQKKALEDTVNIRENTIKYIRRNSDSALNILSHMPYSEMTLDTLSYRKVQSNIENAGAALYLNK